MSFNVQWGVFSVQDILSPVKGTTKHLAVRYSAVRANAVFFMGLTPLFFVASRSSFSSENGVTNRCIMPYIAPNLGCLPLRRALHHFMDEAPTSILWSCKMPCLHKRERPPVALGPKKFKQSQLGPSRPSH
uniref:Uncharacterized protein n=1 Tax=Trypanosoma congolense (strain IL3000) TaxID=1068625 RepID=G0USD8_TRYCI|nr:hypothetical protein, unlikely [Trypanosoma congolense IL3000]